MVTPEAELAEQEGRGFESAEELLKRIQAAAGKVQEKVGRKKKGKKGEK